jgi:hypothetical protein
MKLNFPQTLPLPRHLVIPLLTLALTAGCSSGEDNPNTAIEVQPQSADETAANSSVPSTVDGNNDSAMNNDTVDPTVDSSDNGDDTPPSTDDTNAVDIAGNNNTVMPDGITTFPVCESDATDPDGDGFGFENDVSCVVSTPSGDLSMADETAEENSPTDQETADDATVESVEETAADGITSFPVCISDATDPDGDGFGFENDVSCLVAATDGTDSIEPVTDDTMVDGINTFPACESNASDPDGDGFGFENDVSCLVATPGDADTDDSVSADTMADDISSFPVCDSSATDPDGDGFGFENDRSCVVAMMDTTGSDEANPTDQISDDNPTEQDSSDNSTELASSPFFEGFSNPLPSFSQQDLTSEGATSEFTFGDGFAVVRVDSTADGRERARFTPRGRFDSFSVVMSIEPGSVALDEGWVQGGITAFVFNDTTNELIGDGNCFAGDVGIQVIKRFSADGTAAFVLNAFRETQSECGVTDDAPIFDGTGYVMMETTAGPGESHRLSVAVDRAKKLLTIDIDDEKFTYPLLTDVFQPGNSFGTFETRVDRGPGTAIVRFDEIRAGDQTYNFEDPDLLGRYSFWDAGDPGTSISYPDGELRLESASDSNERGENRLAVTGHDTRYISADIRLSSESIAAGGGDVRARAAGSVYYASETPGDRSALNQVFAVTEIRLLESGATEARYCAWHSLDESFSESVALVNPESESGCNTFALTPVLDQSYKLSTWMDDANRRIVFSIDGEEHFHNIEGPVSIGDELFEMRIQSSARGEGSKAVVFADNLESLLEAGR